MVEKKKCAHCDKPFKPKTMGRDQLYCSTKCRMAAMRARNEEAKPIQQPTLITLEQGMAFLEGYPDRKRLREACMHIFGLYDKPVPAAPKESLQKVPERQIIYKGDNTAKSTSEPKEGSIAYYMKYGEGKKGSP